MKGQRFTGFKWVAGLLTGLIGSLCFCLICLVTLPTPTEPAANQSVQVIVPAATAAANQLEPGHTRPPSATPLLSPTKPVGTGVAAALLPEGVAAQVVRVIDGDTIEVMLEGRAYRVRYIGMDTPERGDWYYQEATAANALMVADQTVILVKDVSETDRFGRLLRYVYLQDGTFVNAELVRQGYAQVATYPPDVAHQELFVALQREARETGVGLWGDVVGSTVEGSDAVAVGPTEPGATATTVAAAPTAQPTQPPAPLPTLLPLSAGEVVISYIFYDGVESHTEGDEYAVITNRGGMTVNLEGWRLNAGDPGQDFWFPAYDLAPGQSCRVYTNRVYPEHCGFSFGRGRAIWANRGECGYLYDQGGVEVSRYCY